MNPKPSKMLPVLYAGVLTGVISSFPLLSFINCCCCAGILGGGVIAVFFYKQHFIPEMPLMTSGDCLQVGALSGLVGACISFLLSGFFTALFGEMMREMILRWFSDSRNLFPPDAFYQLENAMRQMEMGYSFWNLIFSLLLYPVFGMFGGFIGWGIFKPKVVYVQQVQNQQISNQSPSQ
ncbi:MAG: hypothetical protein FJ218_01970 [Ignavibacteria bacterium]|nr:hypothetical protein [Ignavibacteria bacterium]